MKATIGWELYIFMPKSYTLRNFDGKQKIGIIQRLSEKWHFIVKIVCFYSFCHFSQTNSDDKIHEGNVVLVDKSVDDEKV